MSEISSSLSDILKNLALSAKPPSHVTPQFKKTIENEYDDTVSTGRTPNTRETSSDSETSTELEDYESSAMSLTEKKNSDKHRIRIQRSELKGQKSHRMVHDEKKSVCNTESDSEDEHDNIGFSSHHLHPLSIDERFKKLKHVTKYRNIRKGIDFSR